jgi:RNA-directed DNA polymerase
MQLNYSRQDVTGVVVNQKVNIPASYYQTVAAMCHHLFMDGECFVAVGGVKKRFPRRNLRGRLAYIYQVRGKGPKAANKAEDSGGQSPKLWASFKLFERFLNYVDLYGAKRPVILCEGVTDNIYIKAAIQASPAEYPLLSSPTGELKIKQFKYTKSSAAVQQLSGGSGELLKLVNSYSSRTKKFQSPAENPLIIVADSDSANKPLFKIVESRTGLKIGTQPWFHLGSNFYVIPIPMVGGIDTPIERLFDQTLLEAIFEGKKFDTKNAETDGTKFYGKKVFATKVIAPNKATVNFAGFVPLLNAISAAIADYKSKTASVVALAAASADAAAA